MKSGGYNQDSLRIIISFISIYKKDFFEINIKIYYQTTKIIVKDIFKFLLLYRIV